MYTTNMQNLRVERHSAVKNAENDQSLTASFSVFFELLFPKKNFNNLSL